MMLMQVGNDATPLTTSRWDTRADRPHVQHGTRRRAELHRVELTRARSRKRALGQLRVEAELF